nr:hypothetical protein [Candidatus Sigynarchaeum springense]
MYLVKIEKIKKFARIMLVACCVMLPAFYSAAYQGINQEQDSKDRVAESGDENYAYTALWSVADKTIDGYALASEWTLGFNKTLMETTSSVLMVENDERNIYIHFTTTVESTSSMFEVVFDTGNDGVWAQAGEPVFQFQGGRMMLLLATSFFSLGSTEAVPANCMGAQVFSGINMNVEMQLPLAWLEMSPGDTISCAIIWGSSGPTYMYPSNIFEISAWAPIHTVLPDSHDPTLTSPGFAPGVPPYNTNISYTFSIVYTDLDNNAPANGITLILNGNAVAMEKQDPGDFNYIDGCTYVLTTYLPPGVSQYAFVTSKGLVVVRNPVSTDLATPDIQLVNNVAPVLSSGKVNRLNGDVFSEIVYSVIYSDADNNQPQSIEVVVDGTPHSMSRLLPGAHPNYASGVTFVYNTTLAPGSHEFYFTCDDGLYSTRNPLVGNYTGPSIIAGSPSALFDGLYAEYDIPFGLMSYFTMLRYEYALLPNSTYAGSIYGTFVDTVLLQSCNEDPETGTTTSVYTAGGGGGPWIEGGRDMLWIPRNATLGNSFMINMGYLTNITITGEYSVTYGLHNRSCWWATDGTEAYMLFDKATGILLRVHMSISTPGVYYDIAIKDTNAINLHVAEILPISVNPPTGNGSTTFTFKAKIRDLDGIMPRSVSLVVDGQRYAMTRALAAAGPQDVAEGIEYLISTTLPTGTRLYHVEVVDGSITVRNPPASELSLVVLASNLNAPILTDGDAIPFNGTTHNIIIFIVKYTDVNNNPPQSINVSVNGIDLAMQRLDPVDMNMADGCWYYNKMSLSIGAFSYHFSAHDGLFSARDPLAGDLQLNVSSSPVSRLFDVIEADYLITLYGSLSVNFTHVSRDIWTCSEMASMTSVQSFNFNETSSIVTSGMGIGGRPGFHTIYFAPQTISLGSRILVMDLMSTGPIFTEQEYEVMDATVRLVDGMPRACWVLEGVTDPLSTIMVEESTGLLVEYVFHMTLGMMGPITSMTITLQRTNIFNYHPCSLVVNDLPSGTYNTNDLIRFNMTIADADGYEPLFFRIVINGTSFDAETMHLYQGADWASGVDIIFQDYFPAGDFVYFVEYSDGKWYGRYPAGNNSFTINTINNVGPVLSNPRVSPEVTHNYTMPLYMVTYSDADNNAPQSISAIIDGSPTTCYQYDAYDHNYIDGAEFFAFAPPMSPGPHNYTFSAWDGANLASTSMLFGPVINNSLVNFTPFDGLVIDWKMTEDNYGMMFQYSGRDTYHALGTYYNVSQQLQGNPALDLIRFESNNWTVLFDSTLLQLSPGSASMLTHDTQIVYPSAESFVLQIAGSTSNFTIAGYAPYRINGHFVPAWYFVRSGGVPGQGVFVDMHTGLILNMVAPAGMGPMNYTLTGSNALNFHVPSISSPQVTPGTGNETTRFTFSANVTDGDGLVSGVYLVLNGTRIAMRAQDSPTPFKDGAGFTISTYLQAGTWSYHFEVDDGATTVSSPGQDISVVHVDVAAPSVVFNPVTPDRGDQYAIFTFSLMYTDADNNAPHHACVYINGTRHDMVAADPADTNYMDGARFWYETQLSPDAFSYVYYYNTSDDAISNIVSSSYTDLLVRPGAPSLLADDVGYGIFVDAVMMRMNIDYLYAHLSGNQFYVQTWMNGTSLGGYVEDNATRNMTDYVGAGNMFPENFTNPLVILRNVTIGSPVRLISPDGDLLGSITGEIVLNVLGMRFHAWVVVIPNATAYYDVETGFLLRYDYAGSGGIFTITPRYGTMFKNYHLPTLSGGNLINASGNSTVMRRFVITYQDGDNVAPGRANVVINGTQFNMLEVNPLDMNVMDGKDYRLDLYLPAGNYEYNFRFSDNLTTVYFPAGSNGSFVVDYANAYAPVLTAGSFTPMRGYNDTIFVLKVTYADADNSYPIFVDASLLLGGFPLGNITLYQEDPLDLNYMDGATFIAYTSLLSGTYTYNFTAYDGVFISHAPAAGEFVGPIVVDSAPLNSTSLENMTLGNIRNAYGGGDWGNYWWVNNDLTARNVNFVNLQGRVTAAMLETIDVLWLSDSSSTALTTLELQLIVDWVENAGGCVIIVGMNMQAGRQILQHYGVGQMSEYIPTMTSTEINYGHPVSAGVSEVWLNDGTLSLYLRISGSPFTSIVNASGRPEIIAYESASNGKIVAINYRALFDDLGQLDNQQLERNIFGWLGRFNRFGACSITDLGTTPASPTNMDLVTVRASYMDPLDDVRPRYITLWVNGTAFPMHKAVPTDYDYDTGVVYEYSAYFQAGTWSYYIEAADGTTTQYTTMSSFTVSLIDLSNPTLSCWIISNTSHELTVFGIMCNYTDADNNAPAFIEVIGDGGALRVNLVQLDPFDTYYVDGALFYANRTLPLGAHQWLVNASDDGSNYVTYPLGGPEDGPLVVDLDDPFSFWDGMRYNWTYRYSPTSTLYACTTIFRHVSGDIWNITTYRGAQLISYYVMDVVMRSTYQSYSSYLWIDGPGCFFIPRNLNVSQWLNVQVIDYSSFTVQAIYKDVRYFPSLGRYFQVVCLNGNGMNLYYDQKTGLLLDIEYPDSREFTLVGWDAFVNENIPALSSPSMSPSSGSMNIPYTFQVTYTDLDNNEPVGVVLVLDGIPLVMDKMVPADTNYVDGCVYVKIVYLQNGTHAYRFFASDGLFWVVLPAATNFTTPSITFTNTNAPVLSGTSLNPLTGYNYTTYRFTTTYSDADNNAPVDVILNISGNYYAMVPLDPLDTSYVDGVVFVRDLVLSQEGFYSYCVVAYDDTFVTRDPADIFAFYIGPNVTASRPSPRDYEMYLSVPYSWQDTSGGVMTSISEYYDSVIVSLPFSVRLYEEDFTEITICARGFVRMGGTNSYPWHNSIPSYGPDNDHIVGFDAGTDISYVFGPGFVRYAVLSGPNRVVVEFNNMYNRWFSTERVGTFQIVIYESGMVDMNFQSYARSFGEIFIDYGNGINYNLYTGLNSTITNWAVRFVYPDFDPFPPSILIEEPANSTYPYTSVPMRVRTNSPDLDYMLYNVYNTNTSSYLYANQTCAVGSTTMLSLPGSGTFQLHVWAFDLEGNENFAMVEFTVDLGAPYATIVQPSNMSTFGSTTGIPLELTGNPATDSIIYNIWDDTNSSWLYGTNQIYAGPTTFNVPSSGSYAVAAWGRTTGMVVQAFPTVSVFFVDTLPPIVTITTPVNSSLHLGPLTLDLNVTDVDGYVAGAWYNVQYAGNGTWVFPANQTYWFPVSLTLPDGFLRIYAWANDTANHVASSAPCYVTVDTRAPTINHPADFSCIQNQAGVQIQWILNDLMPGQYSVFRNDILLLNWTSFANGIPVNVGVTTTTPGVFNYTIQYRDANGHYGTPDQVFVTVSVVPVATSIPDGSGMVAANSTFNISWTLQAASGPGHYIVTRDGIQLIGWTAWGGNPTTVLVPVNTNMGLGVFNYTIYYNDSANAFGTPDSVLITVNDRPATSHPDDRVCLQFSSVTPISWLITDAYGGSGQYNVYLDGVSMTGWVSFSSPGFATAMIGTSVLGSFNYTIKLRDNLGLDGLQDTVIITVNDAPTVTAPGDFVVLVGQPAVQINWTISDVYVGSGTYRVLNNSVEVVPWTAWSSGTPVSVAVSTVFAGLRNYTIIYRDSFGTYGIQDTVIVTINDVPTIPSPPADFVVGANETSVFITWTVQDTVGGTGSYRVLRNGIEIVSWTPWSSGISILVPVNTNIGIAFWNYTIQYRDVLNAYGIQDSVRVAVNDVPTVIPPSDQVVVVGQPGVQITWTITDILDGSGTYRVLDEGVEVVPWTAWATGTPNNVPVSTAVASLRNYTIIYRDSFGTYGIQDTVIVTINDRPTIPSPPVDILTVQNATGVSITWTIQDFIGVSGDYQVLREGLEIVPWTTWISGNDILISVNTNIGVGIWNYTIVYRDVFGAYGTQDTAWVTVNDYPRSSSPADVVFRQGSIAQLNWTITDTIGSTGTYRVLRDGTEIRAWTAWSSDVPIMPVPVNTATIGNYNYTIVYLDSFGLYGAQDMVLVSINDRPTSTSPANIVVYENQAGQTITWTLYDSFGGGDTYRIYRNDSLIQDWAPWTSGVPVVQAIATDIGTGYFNYTIVYRDFYGYLGVQDEVRVLVNDRPSANVLAARNVPANSTGAVLGWIISDTCGRSGTYSVMLDGSPYFSGNWDSGVALNIPIATNIGFATFNYSLTYADNYTLSGAPRYVLVTIVDAPLSNYPADLVTLGNSSRSFNWTLVDKTGPGQYRVLRDGTPLGSWAAWMNNTPIFVAVNTNIGYRVFNYSIQFNNSAGLFGLQDTVFVTVEDRPVAVALATPVSFYQNTTGNTISWRITDRLGAGQYRVLRSGVPISSWAPWTNNTWFIVPVPSNAGTGSVIYTLEYNDGNGFNGTANNITVTTLADPSAPVLSNLVVPGNPLYGSPVLVSVNVTDAESGVNNVRLFYAVNVVGPFSMLSMNKISGSMYRASIPAQAFGARVYYFVQATNNASASASLGNSTSPYSYDLKYLTTGVHNFEVLSPVHLVIEIDVASAGTLTVASYDASGELGSMANIATLLGAFNLTFTGTINSATMTFYSPSPISGGAAVYHKVGTSWVPVANPEVTPTTVTFTVTSLSPFAVGATSAGGFDIIKFITDNWMMLAIVGVGLIVLFSVIGAARSKKKKAAKAKAAPGKKDTGRYAAVPEAQGKQLTWIEPATKTILKSDEVKSRLKHLFVFHAKAGVCLFYQPFTDATIDPQLISGFISAISSFGTSFEKGAELRVLEYKSFKILLEETMGCRYALLFTGEMEEKLNQLLKAFIGEFESKFRQQIAEFNGNVSMFNLASEIMSSVFKMPVQGDVKTTQQPVPEPQQPFNLFCPNCEAWSPKPANYQVSGGETCKTCAQPLFFVPKCDSCGNGIILPVQKWAEFKKAPMNCDRCGTKLRIQ